MKIMVIDVGGTHIKVGATSHKKRMKRKTADMGSLVMREFGFIIENVCNMALVLLETGIGLNCKH